MKELKKSMRQIVAELEYNSLDSQWLDQIPLDENEEYDAKDPTKVYFIKSGSLIVTKTLTSETILDVQGNNNKIYEVFTSNDLIAIENISDKNTDLTFKMVALDRSELISIDKEYLLNYCANKPSFLETILKYTMMKTLQYEEKSLVFLGSREQRLSWSIETQRSNELDDGINMTNRILSKLSRVDESFVSQNIKKINRIKCLA
ncbi:cyclic nucleotide-binding domain-containing protein [Listeria kieliensis]